MDTSIQRKEWNLNGHVVTQLIIDYRFTIIVWWAGTGDDDNDLSVVVEVPFRLRVGQMEWECRPGEPDTIAPALHLLHRPVRSLAADSAGRLEMVFEPDALLVVERQGGYESWEAAGQGEMASIRLLCTAHDGPPWGE